MKTLPTKTLPEIAEPILKRVQLDIENVRASGGNPHGSSIQEIAWAVHMISVAAKKENWGIGAIGRYLNRNHATIIYCLKKESNNGKI